MSLKKSSGNMYPWVTHTISFLNGACPHACSYCYVQAMAKRYPNMKAKYTGPLRLDEEALNTPLGEGRIIFVEHLNDLWAAQVSKEFIIRVLNRCRCFKNTYVFQTKNPARYHEFIGRIPVNSILGTTIETDRLFDQAICNAPSTFERSDAMMRIPRFISTFVTIEPIMAFDPPLLIAWLKSMRPDFVNIGADSKGRGLHEPTWNDVAQLITGLKSAGIEVRQKTNLDRLRLRA